MKSQLFFVISVLTAVFVSQPVQAINWKTYMSTPNQQNEFTEENCATYAAVHCMEAMYNYWHGLPSKLEIDMPTTSSIIHEGSSVATAVTAIQSNRLKTITGTYPNLEHSYYSVTGAQEIPATNISSYPENNLLDNVKFHLEYAGPVCICIVGYANDNKDNIEEYREGDAPVKHDLQGYTTSYHWVVAVKCTTGTFEGVGEVEYLECLSSFGDYTNYFKINTENFTTWCYFANGQTINGRATGIHLHKHHYDTFPTYEAYDNFNYFYAPKIYPFINKDLNNYDTWGVKQDGYLLFYADDEEIYIMGDTQVYENSVTIRGDYLDAPDNVQINISGSLIEPFEGGYHYYKNDLIANNTINLENCTVKGFGPSYNDCGAVYVNTSGDINITGNVTIQNLDAGIYSKATGLSITGTNNRILNCTYHGVILDNASNAALNNLLINNMGSYGIRLLGDTSDLSATNAGIYSSAYGIYVNAYTDLILNSCNIGYPDAMGGGYDIDYTRIIQGGNSTTINLDYNNITHSSPYYAMDNIYNSVFVDNNWWGNDPVDIDDVFSSPVRALYWNQRATIKYPNTNTPLPKIAAPSPFEIARSYESVEDWTNAKSSYLQAIEQSNDSMLNKRSLKGMLRIYKEQDWPADDLRIIARNEYSKAENKHKPVFDFLYNETYIAEKDYFTAIEMFEKCAEKYAGTSVEVEILSRVANIYGDYLNDPAAAKRYADRAASLNPGQPILMSAYMSAGIWYNPDEYSNKFYHVLEYYDIPEEHDAELATESDVSVTPNPFNPSTVIGYTLTNPSWVELSIYSITGQKVATLVNGNIPAGRHSVTFDGANLASGIYFYRFESAALNKTGKLMLMK